MRFALNKFTSIMLRIYEHMAWVQYCSYTDRDVPTEIVTFECLKRASQMSNPISQQIAKIEKEFCPHDSEIRFALF